MTGPLNTRFYSIAVGTAQSDAFITIFNTRDPTPLDTQFPIQKRWYNTASMAEFILVGFNSTSGTPLAIWDPIAGGGASSQTLTGNSGGAVPPTASNINVIGTGSITVVGTPGTSTLTISATGTTLSVTGNSGGAVMPDGAGNLGLVGSGATTVTGNPGAHSLTVSTVWTGTGNTGGAIPYDAAGNVGIIGTGAIAVSGAGNTLTIAVTQTATGNSGGAIPFTSGGNISIIGAGAVSVAGAGSTLTISNVWTGTTDDSHAVPINASGNVNFVGVGGITTQGNIATNTITINGGSSAGITWSVITADQTAAVGHGYFTNKGSQLNLTLPVTSAVGDTFEAVSFDAFGFKIVQGVGQSVQFAATATTGGAGGSIASLTQGGWVRLVCAVANTKWYAFSNGNFTVI